MSLTGRKMLMPLSVAFAVAAMAFAHATENPVSANALEHDRNNAREIEVRRIHHHFDSVLVELRAGNEPTLSGSQRANRAKLLQTLASYNARAEFPHNYDFDAPTPYFIDRKTGTLCAVAYLLESTGNRDIVDRVARTNNNVWVAALKGDVGFETWLRTNGITLAEAARIQVPYMQSTPEVTQREVIAYGAATIVPLGISLGTSAWNALGNSNGHSRTGAYVGLASSVATTGMGVFIRSQQKGAQGVHAAAYSIGAVGLIGGALATRSLLHRPKYLAERTEAENARRSHVETSIAPIIPLGKDSGAGLSMSIKF